MRIFNLKGPQPQRGFSWVGAEQTSKLRKENLNGQTSWDELTDARVREEPHAFGRAQMTLTMCRSTLMLGRPVMWNIPTSGPLTLSCRASKR